MARRLPGLSFFFSALLIAATAAAEVPISEEARRHFSLGVSFLQDPDGARYEEAYQEFKAAYAASPSWKILGNLGIAAFKLERDGEAIAAFEKYLAEGDGQIDAEERAQFERDLHTLNSAVVKLKLQSIPAGASIVDERVPTSGAPILNRYGPLAQATELGLHPGHHRITAKLTGYQDSVVELDLVPGQSYERLLELKPTLTPVASGPAVEARSYRRGPHVASYVALGVGVVGLGVGTVFGLKAKSEYDQGNELCPSFPCRLTPQQASAREAHGEDGDRAKTVAMAGFIVGGAALATSATLFLLGSRKTEPDRSQAVVRPWVGVASMGLSGTFQ